MFTGTVKGEDKEMEDEKGREVEPVIIFSKKKELGKEGPKKENEFLDTYGNWDNNCCNVYNYSKKFYSPIHIPLVRLLSFVKKKEKD